MMLTTEVSTLRRMKRVSPLVGCWIRATGRNDVTSVSVPSLTGSSALRSDMESLPLGVTASLSSEELWVLAIAIDGKIALVFPRGFPYVKVKKFADKYGGEIRLQRIRATYEVLPDNKFYDTSPKVKY
jgi:hypothetical protein